MHNAPRPVAVVRAGVPPVPLPNDLPVIERSAVRLVVLDVQDNVLLFHTHDPDHPDLGSWWELPGGGIDPGETYLDTAIRELHEETGILADPSQVGPPSWRRRASFRHRQRRHLQDEVIVTLRLLVEREDYSHSDGGPHPKSSTAANASTPAGYPRCSAPSWTVTRSTNRSSCGPDPDAATARELLARSPAGRSVRSLRCVG